MIGDAADEGDDRLVCPREETVKLREHLLRDRAHRYRRCPPRAAERPEEQRDEAVPIGELVSPRGEVEHQAGRVLLLLLRGAPPRRLAIELADKDGARRVDARLLADGCEEA